ncbi:MAG: 3-oxoacyl-ACP reductase FabG [Immundisolibacter sp.]|nr:3-oxoacyl-ACP reductase FabG [Immundisolibacter sp.]MDD3649956.1 3-oxoacyl-ACP reductase FabG [Immundisolibacter sp.]
MRLDGEVALVTGASRGIGRAIALELARAGATVVGTATSEAGARRIGEELAAAGLCGSGMVFNAADREGTAALVDAIKTAHGAVSILVNNAGITRDNLLLLLKDEDWDVVLDTNLGAAFRLARACARGMTRARRGRIINIGSVVGAMGNAGQVNYAAAKAGLAGFTRALARELASRTITVNTVAPGFIETDMTAALNADQRDALLQSVPLARFGEPREVAALVTYLASPLAGYITGQTLHINGGMYLA